VEFELRDPSYPFVRASAEAECRFEMREMLPRGNGRYGEIFSVADADPSRILGLAEASDLVEPRLLADHGTGGLFEFLVSSGCPVRALAERGATPTRVTSTDGTGRIVCAVPPECETADVVAGFLEEHPTVELVAKREGDRPTTQYGGGELRQLLDERLTDRQREVLEAAYEAGYFDRPRETTGEELADELGICGATLSQHLRAAQGNLLSVLYEEHSV
jgi:predicted DNA binding protein